ncbi:MAG TPA: hypothetical protein VFW09_03360 [Solirubrobacteraceae bacterium]|jgi:hypothetical protein|nr:hypothetical protein [Solirubrobacteraceae bacterium]
MPDDKPQKVSIGFAGGPVLSARVPSDSLKGLRDALASGGWHELQAEDGTVDIDLSKVVYVLVDTEAHRVGFGG